MRLSMNELCLAPFKMIGVFSVFLSLLLGSNDVLAENDEITVLKVRGPVKKWSDEDLVWVKVDNDENIIPWTLMHVGPKGAIKLKVTYTSDQGEALEDSFIVRSPAYFRASRDYLRKLKYYSVSIGDISEALKILEVPSETKLALASFNLAWSRLQKLMQEDEEILSIEVQKFLEEQRKQGSAHAIKITSPLNYQLVSSPVFPLKVKIEWDLVGDTTAQEFSVQLSSLGNRTNPVQIKTQINYHWMEIPDPGVYNLHVSSDVGQLRSNVVTINVIKAKVEKNVENAAEKGEAIELISPKKNHKLISRKKVIEVPFTWKLPLMKPEHNDRSYTLVISDLNKKVLKKKEIAGNQTLIALKEGDYTWQVSLERNIKGKKIMLRSSTNRFTIISSQKTSIKTIIQQLLDSSSDKTTIDFTKSFF